MGLEGRCSWTDFQSQLILPLLFLMQMPTSTDQSPRWVARTPGRHPRVTHDDPTDEPSRFVITWVLFWSRSHRPASSPGMWHPAHARTGSGALCSCLLCTWLLSSPPLSPGRGLQSRRGLPGAFPWSWSFVAACPDDEAFGMGSSAALLPCGLPALPAAP